MLALPEQCHVRGNPSSQLDAGLLVINRCKNQMEKDKLSSPHCILSVLVLGM